MNRRQFIRGAAPTALVTAGICANIVSQPKEKPAEIAEGQVYRTPSGQVRIIGDEWCGHRAVSGPFGKDNFWMTDHLREGDADSWTYCGMIDEIGGKL